MANVPKACLSFGFGDTPEVAAARFTSATQYIAAARDIATGVSTTLASMAAAHIGAGRQAYLDVANAVIDALTTHIDDAAANLDGVRATLNTGVINTMQDVGSTIADITPHYIGPPIHVTPPPTPIPPPVKIPPPPGKWPAYCYHLFDNTDKSFELYNPHAGIGGPRFMNCTGQTCCQAIKEGWEPTNPAEIPSECVDCIRYGDCCGPTTPPPPCPPGQVACKVDADCPANYHCVNGCCVPIPKICPPDPIAGIPLPCKTTSDCPPGYVCINGCCVPGGTISNTLSCSTTVCVSIVGTPSTVTVTTTTTGICTTTCSPTTTDTIGEIDTNLTYGNAVSILLPRWCDKDVCDTLTLMGEVLGDMGPTGLSRMIGLYDVNGVAQTPNWMLLAATYPGAFLQAVYNWTLGQTGQALIGIGQALKWASQPIFGSLLGTFIQTDPNQEAPSPAAAALADSWAAMLRPLIDWIGTLLYAYAQQTSCNTILLAYPWFVAQVLTLIQHWLGFDLSGEIRQFDYMANWACPSLIPSAEMTTQMYLKNVVDWTHAKCWIAANDYCPEPYKDYIWSQRTQIDAHEAMSLWLRGYFDDRSLHNNLRNKGYLDDNDIEAKKKLTERLPGQREIVHYSQRDICDDDLAQKLGLDDDVGCNDDQTVDQWWKAAGFSDDTWRAMWRSSRHLPGAGELYRMMFRLRPDVPDGDTTTTPEDVDQVLKLHGFPSWARKRMIKIAYRPMARFDARRGYIRGVLKQKDLSDAYQNMGYDQATAQKIATFSDLDRQRYVLTLPLVKAYLQGGMGDQQISNYLSALGFDDALVGWLKGYCRTIETATSTLECVKGVAQKVKSGGIDGPTAEADLVMLGIEQDRAHMMVSGWICQERSKPKEVGAGQLCQWFSNGLITAADMKQRLVNLGYSQSDANGITALCVKKLIDKQTAAALKREQQIEKAIIKAEHDAEIAREKAARQAAAAKKAAFALFKAEMREASTLEAAAAKWAKKSKDPLPDILQQFTDQVNRMIREHKLSGRSAIEVVKMAPVFQAAGDTDTLETVVDTIYEYMGELISSEVRAP